MRPVGIDFGTTNSLVGASTNDGFQVLAGETGEHMTPSVVTIEDGEAVVGLQAADDAVTQPDRTIFSSKRAIGTGTEYEIDGETYTPVDIASLIIEKLRARAEEALGEPPERCVLTVPARFSPMQRQAVKSAGTLAGLDVQRLLPEPTAACLAHGLRTGKEKTILVLDLGGGTFDISLVEASNNVFEVKRTTGSEQLGGDDWDGAIFEWALDQLESDSGVAFEPEENPVATEQLFDAVNAAKEALTNARSATIDVPYLHHDAIERVDLTLSRGQFQSITAPLRERLFGFVDDLIQAEGLDHYSNRAELDDTVLVGGATRMPQIKDGMKDRYGLSPVRRTDPDTTVALGAAAQASLLDDVDLVAYQSNQTPLSYPSSGSQRPSRRSSTTTLEPTHPDPDSVVLVDTVPETISVVGLKGTKLEDISPLLEAGQSIPCKGSQELTNSGANMRLFDITITQGNPEKDVGDILLDEFTVGPIPPLPAYENEVEVTAEMDADGLLTITAQDKHTDVFSEVVIDGVAAVSAGVEPGETFKESELETRKEGLPDVE